MTTYATCDLKKKKNSLLPEANFLCCESYNENEIIFFSQALLLLRGFRIINLMDYSDFTTKNLMDYSDFNYKKININIYK